MFLCKHKYPHPFLVCERVLQRVFPVCGESLSPPPPPPLQTMLTWFSVEGGRAVTLVFTVNCTVHVLFSVLSYSDHQRAVARRRVCLHSSLIANMASRMRSTMQWKCPIVVPTTAKLSPVRPWLSVSTHVLAQFALIRSNWIDALVNLV